MSIIENLGECELLCQLAEEASELAQAALKLRRALDGKNPTPRDVDSCRADLLEELADVQLVASVLGLNDWEKVLQKCEIAGRKKARWEQRMEERNVG